jgi:hypothetical protein
MARKSAKKSNTHARKSVSLNTLSVASASQSASQAHEHPINHTHEVHLKENFTNYVWAILAILAIFLFVWLTVRVVNTPLSIVNDEVVGSAYSAINYVPQSTPGKIYISSDPDPKLYPYLSG